jgi:Ca2+-binding RTX toxin-like protein
MDALGALSNVENATGGSGDDLIVGDDKDNVLVGGAGRDVIIGGKGADQIFGGGGEDLLIASDTAFDNSGGSLETIRSTWAGSGNTQSRINTLRNGVGGVQLNDSTVHVSATVNDDAARDVLSGDAASSGTSDWFWANYGTKANQDSLADYLSSTDVLN